MELTKYENKVVLAATVKECSVFFDLSASTINRHIRAGERYDWIYVVLNRPEKSLDEKKKYVFGLTLSKELKRSVWDRYINYIKSTPRRKAS